MEKKAISGIIGLLFLLMLGSIVWNSMLTPPALAEPSTIPAKRKAVWFGLYSKTWTQGELDNALTSFKNAGIEIVFLLVKVPWGGPNGNVYFNSSIVPMVPEYSWDCLAYVVQKAHEKGMEVHPYLNILEDGYFRYYHPEMAMVHYNGANSTTWVSPAYQAVRDHQINLMVEVVQEYDVDGIQMDRIRFPDTNYDYNPEMKRLYKEKYGKDPVPGDADWVKFRKDMVSNLTRDIYTAVKAVKPHVKFSAAVFASPVTAPLWQLQDWPTWVSNRWLDFPVTMAYTDNLTRLKELVNQEIQTVDCLMALYVGLGAWILNTTELQDQLNAVNITGVDGVAFFSGQWLVDNPTHLNVIGNFSFGSLNITLGVLNTTIIMGENVTVSGSLNSHLKDINVTFNYTRPNGSLVQRTAPTNSCGKAVDAYKPDAIGTWNVSVSVTIKEVKIESQTISFLVNSNYNQPQAELYVGASADPNVYDPVNIMYGYEPCNNFTVYIKVRNITDLWGVSFFMNYNSTVLNCTEVRYGAVWGIPYTDYIFIPGIINRTKGSIEAYDGSRMNAALPTNATLFEINFHVLEWGESLLQISGTPTELRDSALKLIYCPITDGLFNIPEVHDVAVINETTFSAVHGSPSSPYTPVTECYPTWIVEINVTVQNQGSFTETFTVQAFYGNTTGNYTIGISPASYSVTLAPGTSTTKTFTWDVPDIPKVFCTKFFTYTIYANASVVPSETDTADNTRDSVVVKVKWPGDGNGDGLIGLSDLMVLSMSYKKSPGDVGYNPQADFSGDGGQIGLPDLMILSMNYRKGPCDT